MQKEQEQVFTRPNVIIVGYGIVGKNLHKIFDWADIFDKYNGESNNIKNLKYDFCFVCVPTPQKENGSANIDEVCNAIEEVDADIYIIKSTIPPTTTEQLTEKYNKKIVFSPEYNGNTQHSNVENNFLILGGKSEITFKVSQLYQYVSTADIKIYQVDSRTAELCKYMENCFLASKVVFCNEFYRMAKKLNVNYNILRECFVLDPRVNPSHTFVYEDYPYYDSKCFNKDLPAIVKQMEKYDYNAQFIKAIIENNQKFKDERFN